MTPLQPSTRPFLIALVAVLGALLGAGVGFLVVDELTALQVAGESE